MIILLYIISLLLYSCCYYNYIILYTSAIHLPSADIMAIRTFGQGLQDGRRHRLLGLRALAQGRQEGEPGELMSHRVATVCGDGIFG